MTDDIWDIPPPTPEQDFADRLAHYARMRAKVKELRGYYKDAMRYRWIRANCFSNRGDTIINMDSDFPDGPDAFDAAIDSELSVEAFKSGE